MNIAVLMKQVPDTGTMIKIGDDGKSIDENGIKWIINPYDEYAVEGALRLKESHGGNITILSLGPERTVEAIRWALAMGADKGVLLDNSAIANSDALGKAKILAAALKDIPFDIIFCGNRAVDGDESQVGIMVAELLDIPHLGLAVDVNMVEDQIEIERPTEGMKVKLASQLPALVTFGGAHAIWKPRRPSLIGIKQAGKKPLEIKRLSSEDAKASKIMVASLKMPAPRQTGLIVEGEGTAAKAKELVRLLREKAVI